MYSPGLYPVVRKVISFLIYTWIPFLWGHYDRLCWCMWGSLVATACGDESIILMGWALDDSTAMPTAVPHHYDLTLLS